jgi:hypothetical protein
LSFLGLLKTWIVLAIDAGAALKLGDLSFAEQADRRDAHPEAQSRAYPTSSIVPVAVDGSCLPPASNNVRRARE